MDYGIAGTTALVTGASRGIGRAVAGALAREGATVALVARSREALEAVADEIQRSGGRAVALPADLGRPEDVRGVAERAREALRADPLLAVIGHATLTPMAKIHSLAPDAVRHTIATDLEATLALLGALMPSMMAARFGRVVFLGSASASLGQGGAPLYTAIKAAREGLARNHAIDFTRYGITANVVAPGFVDTERLRSRTDDAARARLVAATAASALATPAQVAEVVAFLCSRAASYVSGAVLPVTGGAHLSNLW